MDYKWDESMKELYPTPLHLDATKALLEIKRQLASHEFYANAEFSVSSGGGANISLVIRHEGKERFVVIWLSEDGAEAKVSTSLDPTKMAVPKEHLTENGLRERAIDRMTFDRIADRYYFEH
jgi:hypothetical protein